MIGAMAARVARQGSTKFGKSAFLAFLIFDGSGAPEPGLSASAAATWAASRPAVRS